MKIEYTFEIKNKRTAEVDRYFGVSFFKVLPEGFFYLEYPETVSTKNMAASFKSLWIPIADIESVACITDKTFSNHSEFGEFINPKKKTN